MPNVLLDGCLMIVLVFSCNLRVCVAECVIEVLASRKTLYVPEGGSHTLQCEIQECGQKDWTAEWRRKAGETFASLTPSSQLHLSNYTVSANKTRLLLNIQNLRQSDSGEYKCTVSTKNYTGHGHITYLNVTTSSHVHIAAAESTHRKLSHRFLVWVGASLCFPLALGLACCLASIRLRPPPVPPRFRSTSTARVKPQVEVVYTSVVLKNPRQTKSKSPAERQSTVYSSVNFSTV